MNNQYSHGKPVPGGKAMRLTHMLTLASSVAGSVFVNGVTQLSRGQKPDVKDLILTPANAQRLASRLMKMRGAALKVGQLISMDAGEILPKELTLILSKLRDDADPMPFSQLVECLEHEWGQDWPGFFKQFSFTPIAAASIGQVHTAVSHDDQKLALKIQYPNVEKSIDSDVDNVAGLMRLSGLVPDDNKLNHLFDETKRQLHMEADYLAEADWLMRFKNSLANRSDIVVPQVYPEYTTKKILAMSYHEGIKIDALTSLPQNEKNTIAITLVELLLLEIFVIKYVQTDPNLANYLYDPSSKRIVLLDFGAVRKIPGHISDAYRQIMSASINSNNTLIDNACEKIGFFKDKINPQQRKLVVDLFNLACEPLKTDSTYDFGQSSLAAQISQQAMNLSTDKSQWHTPPADALFLHRKIAGTYLLLARLNANINVSRIFSSFI